jgi:hypothetical protein
MKKIIPFLFLFSLLSCTNEKENLPVTESQVAVSLDTLIIGNKVYCTQSLIDTNYNFSEIIVPHDTDNVTIQKHADIVSRSADSLFLKCDNGKVIKLVNNKSQDDNYKLFNFVNLNTEIDYYVINCLYVESMNFLLVNKKNGHPIETFGYPVTSPDKNYFVCGNCDLIANFDVNGISIYKKNKNNYELIGTRELTNWGPTQMLWKNDTTLIIKGDKLKTDNTTTETIYKALFIK